jgi:spore coat polysaccharide biosynthesis protein SpsF
MSKRVFGLVQARMGSTRLPGKVMLDLAGKPMVEHIFDRLRRVRGVSGIVLATTQDNRNDNLARYAQAAGITVWREPEEDDIAARLYNAATLVDADAILKVNADCPLIDCDVLGRLIDAYRGGHVAYVSNKQTWTWPKGLSAEVIDMAALRWCHENLTAATDREYVADWIKARPSQFPAHAVESGMSLGHLDWMVDTPADMDWMRRVFDELYRPDEYFGLQAVLDYMKQHAE